jgi:hypothetical protein
MVGKIFVINCTGQDASQKANNGCKKNFPAFYKTRNFITVFATARQLTPHQDQSSPHAQTQYV